MGIHRFDRFLLDSGKDKLVLVVMLEISLHEKFSLVSNMSNGTRKKK